MNYNKLSNIEMMLERMTIGRLKVLIISVLRENAWNIPAAKQPFSRDAKQPFSRDAKQPFSRDD